MRQRRTPGALSVVPVLVCVAVVALLCSFSLRPFSNWLYDLLPMFRSYARFGSVVQLMVALLAAIGAERLWHARRRAARVALISLVLLGAAEYAVSPAALWRDVLPTEAHRWVADQPASTRALDCAAYSRESQSVQWLSGGRIVLRSALVGDCREPGTIAALAANGFNYMLIRRNTPEGVWFEGRPPPSGLRLARRFHDGEVLAVIEPPSPIRTLRTDGFYPVEFGRDWAWRWMRAQASWTVVNVTMRVLMASVDLETSAFSEPRTVTVVLDGSPVQDVVIEPKRAVRRIGPLAIGPGDHTLLFRAATPPTVADMLIRNGDPRPLSIAFGEWRWSIDGGR
jgi:hypothetical protein